MYPSAAASAPHPTPPPTPPAAASAALALSWRSQLLNPTRQATDVANAVLDGVDGILLGAETLRGARLGPGPWAG
jgi:hypothetical protein